MNRTPYHSDLNHTEWQLLELLLPPPKPGGRPIKYPRREIVNVILYILRTGTTWRMLPHDMPPYRIVFHYYRTWQQDGVWRQVKVLPTHTDLRNALNPYKLAIPRSTMPCASKPGRVRGAIPNPAPPLSTANR